MHARRAVAGRSGAGAVRRAHSRVQAMLPPRVSIVLASCNGARTLAETLHSVLTQSFEDFELLIVDDGSTDGTPEILADIPDPRVQVEAHARVGSAANRNRGIARARGEFVALLDQDDVWTADKLQRQVAALEAQPQSALVFSWVDRIDAASAFLHPGPRPRSQGDVRAALLCDNILVTASNPLLRRSCLPHTSPLDPSVCPAEDWDLWLRLAERYPFVCLPEVHVLYRDSAWATSCDFEAMERAVLAVHARAFDRAPPHLQALRGLSLANIFTYLCVQALKDGPSRARGRAALRYLRGVLRHAPTSRRAHALAQALASSLAMASLPGDAYLRLASTFPRFFDARALYTPRSLLAGVAAWFSSQP